MSHLKTAFLVLLLSCLAACGRQVVEFELEFDAGVTPGLDAGATPGRDAGSITAPLVTDTLPVNGVTAIALNTSISATFSKAMDSTTLNATTFTVKQGATSVTGAVTYASATRTATFAPAASLANGLVYTATITIGAKDTGGVALAAPYSWSFTTVAASAPPTVTSTTPPNLSTNVAVNKPINATFSEDMKLTTMIAANFQVKETVSTNSVAGTVAYDVLSKAATFLPQSDLAFDTDYTVTVTNGAQDLAGNALVVPAVGGLPKPNPWSFRTAKQVVVPPPLAINLGKTATFGLASRAGLTTTGVTVVNGDVALYPLASCTDATGNSGASQTCLVKTYASPTGMTVNGSIFWAGDPFDSGLTANTVANDLNTAWVEGKNKIDTKGAIAADELSGKIFTPGVYHNAALGLAAHGTATMDAQNDANAVFIFKVDSSFVDSGTLLLPTKIALINSAQARNVWFIAGLDITIGSGSTWNGNLLAGRTATVLDGSTVMGRVLAGATGAGAVTLTGAASPSVTTITVPQ